MPKFAFKTAKEFANEIPLYTDDIIKDICPVGVTLLYASMKQGKSLLAISAAKSVAAGEEKWLDFPIITGGMVLYFGLDDTNQELHKRLNQYADIENFYIVTKEMYKQYCAHPYLNGMDDQVKFNCIVNDFISQYGHVSLVVADTFEKIRNTYSSRDYANEVKEVSILKNNAESKGYNLFLVHHSKKDENHNDFGAFYGSNGLGAEVSVMLHLTESSNSDYQILKSRGNNSEDTSILVERRPDLTYASVPIEEADLIEDNPDKEYIKIVKYFTKQTWIEKNDNYYKYRGEYQDFITLLDLEIDPRNLGKLLKKYQEAFEEQHITYSVQKSNSKLYLEMVIDRRS